MTVRANSRKVCGEGNITVGFSSFPESEPLLFTVFNQQQSLPSNLTLLKSVSSTGGKISFHLKDAIPGYLLPDEKLKLLIVTERGSEHIACEDGYIENDSVTCNLQPGMGKGTLMATFCNIPYNSSDFSPYEKPTIDEVEIISDKQVKFHGRNFGPERLLSCRNHGVDQQPNL